MCGLQWLSAVWEPPKVDPEQLHRGCPRWEKILHDTAPVLQCYISNNHQDHYQQMKNDAFSDYLLYSQFYTAKVLQESHWLTDHAFNRPVMIEKVCALERNNETHKVGPFIYGNKSVRS